MNTDTGLQLDLLGALQRRVAMIVSIVGGSLLAAYWIAMALPNYHTSSATIFVEPQALNRKLVESGADVYDLSFRLSLMTSQILSRPRLSRVIDELELYADESETMLREEVISLMRDRIQVKPVKTELGEETKGRRDAPTLNTFMVAFTHKDPQLAADVAQRLANDFVKEHIEARVGMTRKSLEFVESELKRQNDQFRGIEDRIAAVKNENPGRLPEDLMTNQRMLDRTMTELREAHRDLDSARSNKAFWDSQVLSAVALGDPRDDASPVRKMQLLELQLAEFRARGFTEKHPDFIRASQEIEEVRSQVQLMTAEDSEDRAPTVAQQNAEAQRERSALEVEMAGKEVERLRASADMIEGRIAQTPRVAEQLNELIQASRATTESIRLFASRQLQAKVQVDVERRQLGEQFRILESAFPAPTPSSPNRLLIIVMGVVVGLAVGVGAAVLAEASDSSFHVVRDVQTTLSIPVLAAIPEIVLDSDRAIRRRRLVRNGLAASSVVLFCLTGGAVTYMYVNGLPGWLSGEPEREAPAEDLEPSEPAAALPATAVDEQA